jgi:hypothetical protein
MRIDLYQLFELLPSGSWHGVLFVDTDVSKEAETLSFISSLNVVLNYPRTRQHGVNPHSRSMGLYPHRNLKSYSICHLCVVIYIYMCVCACVRVWHG